MTREPDVTSSLALGASYAGFIFHDGSKRFVTPAYAAVLWRQAVQRHAGRSIATKPVAVVVDWTADDLARALDVFPELAVVQFHGRETPDEIARLSHALRGRESWKVIGVARPEDLRRGAAFAGVADLILYDNVRGGSGQTFDWSWLGTNPPAHAFGLAGGINPRNLRDALAHRPRLVDLSSGVESAPGIKDKALLAEFAKEMARP